MKTTELQKLFAYAKNTEDLIAIFEANPGLEDEILELGKKQGINLDEPRELTNLELELVAGGIDLKKGAMITMSTLLLAGTLTAPLAQTQKAHADTIGDKAKTEQVQTKDNPKKDPENKEDGIGINPRKPEHNSTNNNPDLENSSTSVDDVLLNSLIEGLGMGIQAAAKAEIPVPVLSDIIGKAGSTFVCGLFKLGKPDPNALTRDEIKKSQTKLLEAIDQSTVEILNNSNANAHSVKDYINKNANETNNKIDSVFFDNVLQQYASQVGCIGKTINQASVDSSLDVISKNDPEEYKAQKSRINKALAETYNGENMQTKYLYYSFMDISDLILGIQVRDKNLSIIDMKKYSINAANKYSFDNESIDEREAYLINLAKTYTSQYIAMHQIVSFERNTCVMNYLQEHTDQVTKAYANLTDEQRKTTSMEDIINNISNDSTDEQGRTLEGLDVKYANRMMNAGQDLRELENSYNMVLKKFKKEFAKLNYEKNHKDVFILDDNEQAKVKAYKIEPFASFNYDYKIDGINCQEDADFWDIVDPVLGKTGRKIYVRYNQDTYYFPNATAISARNDADEASRWLKESVSTFNKTCKSKGDNYECPINTPNIIGHLCEVYNNSFDKDSLFDGKIDGIFTNEGDFSVSEYGNYHVEYYWGWNEHKRSHGTNLWRGLKMTKKLHYIDSDDDATGKDVAITRYLDFKDATNLRFDNESKVLGKIIDYTSQYERELQNEIVKALAQ